MDRQFEVLGATIRGGEVGANFGPLPVGNHLRWFFRPDLGFPAGGFVLERRIPTIDEFGGVTMPEDAWQEIAEFPHPGATVLGNLVENLRLDPELADLVGPLIVGADPLLERAGPTLRREGSTVVESLQRVTRILDRPPETTFTHNVAAGGLAARIARLGLRVPPMRLGDLGPQLPSSAEFDGVCVGDVREIDRLRQLLVSDTRSTRPHRRAFPDRDSSVPFRVRPMLVATLAALDPVFARLLGLGHVDATIAPGSPVQYRVTGRWNHDVWPRDVRRPADIRTRALGLGTLDLDGLVIETDRSLALERDTATSAPTGIVCRGEGMQQVRFHFPHPVRRCVIVFAAHPEFDPAREWLCQTTTDGPTFRPNLPSDMRQASPRLTRDGNRVVVEADTRAGSPWSMDRLTLAREGRRIDRLEILEIVLTGGEGALNTRVAEVFFNLDVFEPAQAREITRRHDNDPPLTVVNDPDLLPFPAPPERLEPQVAEEKLDGRGKAVPARHDLSLHVAAPSGADAEGTRNGHRRPVRLHVRRTRESGVPRPGAIDLRDVVGRRLGTGSIRLPEITLRRFPRLPALDPVVEWDLLTSGSIPQGVRPDRVLSLPLDGDFRLADDGRGVPMDASVAFESFHPHLPRGSDRKAAVFVDKGGAATADILRALRASPGSLLLRAWVKPAFSSGLPGSKVEMAIFTQPARSTLWFGLVYAPRARKYAIRLVVNGARLESSAVVTPGRWMQIEGYYDGTGLRLWANGHGVGAAKAQRGPVAWSDHPLFIAQASESEGSRRQGFRGSLSDLAIWTRQYADLQPGHPEFIAGWPLASNTVELASRSAGAVDGPVRFVGTPFGGAMELGPGGRLMHRIPGLSGSSIGNHFTIDLLLELKTGPGHGEVLCLGDRDPVRLLISEGPRGPLPGIEVLGGRHFADRPLPPENWRHLRVSVAGRALRFWIDGVPAGCAQLHAGIDLVIGGSGVSIGAERGGFEGAVANIAIWSASGERLSPALVRDPAAPLADDGPSAPADYVDRRAIQGTSAYATAAVDLFSRTSAWSGPSTARLGLKRPPDMPTGVEARIAQLELSIEAAAPLDPPHTDDGRIHTRLTAAATGIEPAFRLAELVATEAQVVRRGEHTVRDAVEVLAATWTEAGPDRRLVLDVAEHPLRTFRLAAGDRVALHADQQLRLRWMRTGAQCFYSRTVDEFCVSMRTDEGRVLRFEAHEVVNTGPGAFDVITEMPASTLAPDDLVRVRFARVGESKYRIAGITSAPGGRTRLDLRYGAAPMRSAGSGEARPGVPEPGQTVRIALPVRHRLAPDLSEPGAWNDAAAAGGGDPLGARVVARMPARPPNEYELEDEFVLGPLSAAARERVSDIGWINPATARMARVANCGEWADEAREGPDAAYPPGLLVALPKPKPSEGWAAIDVLFHFRDGDDLILIFGPGDRTVPDGEVASFARARWIPGQNYRLDLIAPPLPAAATRRSLQLGVSALGEHGESRIAGPAPVYQLDRKLPPRPPAPEVVIGEPEVTGIANAIVRWPDPGAGTSMAVLRALTESVFEADQSLRRRRTGPYTGRAPLAIFADDSGFPTWQAARFPEMDESDLNAFFDGASSSHPGTAMFWRDWAARFYPTIDDAHVRALADVPEIEAVAFSPSLPRPVPGTLADGMRSARDRVRGDQSTPFLYKLGAQTENGLRSPQLSPASRPASAPAPRAPASPEIVALEPADRGLTVRWGHVPSSRLKSYRLYRAGRREDLEDLRWFAPSDEEGRALFEIGDARARWTDGSTRSPTLGDAARVTGVFAMDAPVGTGFDPPPTPGADRPVRADLRAWWRVGVAMDADEFVSPPGVANLLPEPVTVADPPGDLPEISGLLPARSGQLLAIAFETVSGEARVAFGGSVFARQAGGTLEAVPLPGAEPAFHDAPLYGRADVFYRLAAIGVDGFQSQGSNIRAARPLEIAAPLAPAVTLSRVPAAMFDEVALEIVSLPEPVELLIFASDAETGQESTDGRWLRLAEGDTRTFQILPELRFEVGVHYRALGGTRASIPLRLVVNPLGTLSLGDIL